MYDQTGSLEDSGELAGEQFDSLYKYYRGLYRKVSVVVQGISHSADVANSLTSMPDRKHQTPWLQLCRCFASRMLLLGWTRFTQLSAITFLWLYRVQQL